jgi:hypothetical protein
LLRFALYYIVLLAPLSQLYVTDNWKIEIAGYTKVAYDLKQQTGCESYLNK